MPTHPTPATKDIFCASCRLVTTHHVEIDDNGEYILTCATPECGRFLKFAPHALDVLGTSGLVGGGWGR